jgi:hypothetical protein
MKYLIKSDAINNTKLIKRFSMKIKKYIIIFLLALLPVASKPLTPVQFATLELKITQALDQLSKAQSTKEAQQYQQSASKLINQLSSEPQLQRQYQAMLSSLFKKIVNIEMMKKLDVSDIGLKEYLDLSETMSPEELKKAIEKISKALSETETLLKDKQKMKEEALMKHEKAIKKLEKELTEQESILKSVQGPEGAKLASETLNKILIALEDAYSTNKIDTKDTVFPANAAAAIKIKNYLYDLADAAEKYSKTTLDVFGTEWKNLVNRIPDKKIE